MLTLSKTIIHHTVLQFNIHMRPRMNAVFDKGILHNLLQSLIHMLVRNLITPHCIQVQ